MKSDEIVSAQVVLVAASGARLGPGTRITSENVVDWAPSVESIERVSVAFEVAGFDVGVCVGNSFSITGTVLLFESCFGTGLRKTSGGVQFAHGGVELFAENVPSELQADIDTVTFTPPPDFGPGADASFL